MALSGGAVGFSASILDPESYAGFWTSTLFQMHAGLQFLSVAFGVAFALTRIKIFDTASQLSNADPDQASVGQIDQLRRKSRLLGRLARSTLYAHLMFL